MRHHTKDKGDQGVGFVIADLMSCGIQVALPISEHLPFDCIGISAGGELSRISVKFREAKFGRIEVRMRSSWADSAGSHTKLHDLSRYDATAIYCPQSTECYYVLNREVEGSTLVLRIDPPKNNQKKQVKLARHYRDPNRLFIGPGSSVG